jgi:hypothetical protein
MNNDVFEQLYAQLQQAYCQAVREYQQESRSMTIKQFCDRYPKLLHTTLATYNKIAIQDPRLFELMERGSVDYLEAQQMLESGGNT